MDTSGTLSPQYDEVGRRFALRVRFCIAESRVDSVELQNRWLFESLREGRFCFWQKPKVAKTFWILWNRRIVW